MTTQVFVASTAFGLATLVAALDDGAFAPAERRVLVLSHNSATPETAHRIEDVAGAHALITRFDAVDDYNEAIAPQHPSVWRPRAVDLPLFERQLASLWSLSADVHLIVESIQVSPALTLCRILSDARIDVYADGLMSYGPTRNQLPALVAVRIERLLHLDLVPGLSPVLLTEFGVPARVISGEAFQKAVAALDPPPDLIRQAPPATVAVLLGQYLSAGGILTEQEELELHLEMIRGAAAAGFPTLVFKPHPSAPPLLVEPLLVEARRLGVSLTVHDRPELVETWYRFPGVGCVVGCFSTALMTAAVCYGLPAARVGTELLLHRLRPYQNSNRIPITLIDAIVPHVCSLSAEGAHEQPYAPSFSPGALGRLVSAVSYCMQSGRYPELRPVAEQLLKEPGTDLRRYFKRRRLTQLDLPGRLPEPPPPPVRPHRLRRTVRRLLGPALTAQVRPLAGRVQRTVARARTRPAAR